MSTRGHLATARRATWTRRKEVTFHAELPNNRNNSAACHGLLWVRYKLWASLGELDPSGAYPSFPYMPGKSMGN